MQIFWGSGVYSQKYNIKKFDLNTNFDGSVTGAEIEVNENYSLIVISLYGLMEHILNVSYAIPNLHRIFSDLTWLLEGASTKHRIVIGGDFNASIQIDKQQTGNSHRVFFDRLREFQLVNCFDKFFQNYVQTHRHRRSKFPWQNDYFFISKRLEPLLIDCEVISNETVNKMSDHNPVLITLNIENPKFIINFSGYDLKMGVQKNKNPSIYDMKSLLNSITKKLTK